MLKDTLNLKSIRRHLHQNPEIAEQEWNTSKLVVQTLEDIGGFKIIYPIGVTGVCAVYDSSEDGPTVLIRGDMDALPIQEESDLSYRSQTDGVAHLCGHDGHTTMLLGLAQEISKNPIQRGKVLLVFQPAEENGRGAKNIINDPQFEFKNIDFVFALHNLPGYDHHKIILRRGSFTAHVNTLIIKLTGKSAHAAEPEFGYNPTQAAGDIFKQMKDVEVTDTNENDFYLITPVYTEIGQKDYGISAYKADIRFTIRSWTSEIFEEKSHVLKALIKQIAEAHHLKVSFEWTHEFPANKMDDQAVDLVQSAADSLGLKSEERQIPFKWGEDFGVFTQRFKGAMFGLGAGVDTPALHNPDYDFPDEILSTGVNMFKQIINEIYN